MVDRVVLIRVASGKQGGATLRHLATQGGFKIGAMTRNPDSPAASLGPWLRWAPKWWPVISTTAPPCSAHCPAPGSVRSSEHLGGRRRERGRAGQAACKGGPRPGRPALRIHVRRIRTQENRNSAFLEQATHRGDGEGVGIPFVHDHSSRVLHGEPAVAWVPQRRQAGHSAAARNKIAGDRLRRHRKVRRQGVPRCGQDDELDIAGDAVTMAEAAEAMSELLGKKVTYQPIPGGRLYGRLRRGLVCVCG